MNNLSIFLASCQDTHGREKGAPDDAPVLDILMVTYRSEAFERAAIDSIRAKTDVPYRLTVIDNNADNRSLTQIWNAFARQSRAPYLCFVNPDIICGAGWASALLRALDMPSVAVASPSMPYRGGGAGDPCSRLQALDAPEVFDAAGSLIEAQMDALASQLPSIVLDDPYGYGYCYGVRRDWMVSLGYFDESFVYYGQETDFSYRTILAGRRVVCVKDSLVYHMGQGSSNGAKTPELLVANRRAHVLLRDKHPSWSVLLGWYADAREGAPGHPLG
ncbi:glycosyltransferase family 2 protein [Hydrogenophaga sp. NFH-34]|uniref:glycosyltransferase family 2 protein n=1 Tax=Hydrogenophaga sp. NFH-34 TaxID=2744446 RepID=UPI001F452BE0|nr:hypothetical protein [Hydrogenophaga sp. NFH-34]